MSIANLLKETYFYRCYQAHSVNISNQNEVVLSKIYSQYLIIGV